MGQPRANGGNNEQKDVEGGVCVCGCVRACVRVWCVCVCSCHVSFCAIRETAVSKESGMSVSQ